MFLSVAACGGGSDGGTYDGSGSQGSAEQMPGPSSVLSMQLPPGQLGAALANPENATLEPVVVMQDGPLSPLADSEYSALPLIERYRVANKLSATFYSGIAVEDFFELESGFTEAHPAITDEWLSSYRAAMLTPLNTDQRARYDLEILGSGSLDDDAIALVEGEVPALFDFGRDRPRELPLARIYHYPPSLDKASQWMAWHLANTLLFSPSSELDSAGMTDVQNVMRRLDRAILSNQPVRDVVYEHMRSVENWRRFRSPEDNTREMLEIFLGFEDLDDEVPAASTACRDLYLTDDRDGYQLAYTDFPNTEAQTVLGQPIVACDDFYRLVATHEALIPTVARTLVGYFFSTRDTAFKVAAVDQLVSSGAETFLDLFLPIVFSKAYLFDTEKVKSFEESFLSISQRIHWRVRSDMFRGLASGEGGLWQGYLAEMSWAAMSNKLGRPSTVPTDSLSFANYHKALREKLLINTWRWDEEMGISRPSPPDPAPLPAPPEEASAQAISDYETVVAQNAQTIEAMPADEKAEYYQALERFEEHTMRHDQVVKLSIPEFIDYLFLSVALRRANPREITTLIGLFDQNEWIRIEEEGQYINKWNRANAARLVMDYLSRLPEIYYHRHAGDQ